MNILFEQQVLNSEIWNSYNIFLFDKLRFNNKAYPQSHLFYQLQDKLINLNPNISIPVIDSYINYIDQDLKFAIYLFYSPFIWINKGFRLQLSKLLYKISKLKELLIHEDYDDCFMNFIYYQTPRLNMSKGVANSLNLWCYLLSLHLIPSENIPQSLHIMLESSIIPNIVDIIVEKSRIPIDNVNDWYMIMDNFVILCNNIYNMSINKGLIINYHVEFFKLFKSALINLKEYKTFQAYLIQTNCELSNQTYEDTDTNLAYIDLFTKSAFHIPESWYAGVILLCTLYEDIIDWFLSNIPFIYRNIDNYPNIDIDNFIYIFKYIYGVNNNELYPITDS